MDGGINMSRKILFINDEANTLKEANKLFQIDGYRFHLASSGAQALEFMTRIPVDMVITDMRLSDFDGYQLLKKLREKFPHVMRLIIANPSDEKLVLKAIEAGLARMYVIKPWDGGYFKNIVSKMFETKEMLESNDLINIMHLQDKLPTMPTLYTELCDAIESDSNMEDVAKIIETDQSTAARVLHIANTAFFGARTGNIKQATMYLGFSNLKNIVLSSVLFEQQEENFYSKYVSMETIWKHASLSNKIVNIIYDKLLGRKVKDVGASAGLLHDIGKILLIKNFPTQYMEVVKKVATENKTFEEVEKEFFSVSHMEVGAFLLNWWGLPHPIVESALFHHDPLSELVVNKELLCVVNLADYYSWNMLSKLNYGEISPAVFEYLKLNKEACDALIENIEME